MKIDATQWQQLSELLDTALELPVAQREQWLESLPEDMANLKPTLRALLVQTAGVETKDFLDRPPDFAAALMTESAHTEWAEEFQVDKVMGAYRLIRELGRGGMGVVWLAERIDGKLKRQVALKFPYAGPNQGQLAERLTREREILASLEHPNIARLYDADITANGQPFLVLEYIDGIPLNEYCDHQQLSIDERLKLFQQVLDAVRYAHSHLVIHRDLKPSNILITSDGMAHLLDFGIAKLAVNGEVKETALTQIGGRALTPDYASPEQLTGEAIITVSDVYSLGVLLYELLTGSRPYRLQRNTRVALEEAIVTADIVLPSHVRLNQQIAANRKTSIRQLQKTLVGDLDTLILKALKKSPTERYASADAFLDDVNRYIHQQPILAQSDTQWYRVKKFVVRNRLVVASASTIALTLIVGTGAALWQAHQAKLQRDRAVASAARSEAVTDFLQLMVTEVADADEPITMQQLIARSEDIANRTYVGDANQQAAILEVLGNYYLAFNRADEAVRAFTKALNVTGDNLDNVSKGKLLCMSAAAEIQNGNTQSAQQKIQVGFELTSSVFEAQAVCLRSRAFLKYRAADVNGVLQDLQMAQQNLQRSGVSMPGFAAELLANEASVYGEIGQAKNADRQFARAIELLGQYGRGETAGAMLIEFDWAIYKDNSGEPMTAMTHYDRALEILRKRNVNNSYEKKIAASRASALLQLGRPKEALAGFAQGAELAHANHLRFDEVYAKVGMARALLELNNELAAEKIMGDVISGVGQELSGSELKMNDISMNDISVYQGYLAMRHKRFADASKHYSDAISRLMKNNIHSTLLARMLQRRGDAFFANNKIASALDDATQAWNIAHGNQGDALFSKASGDAALLLAKIHQAKNENDEAFKWAAIAVTQLQGSVGATHPSALEAKDLLVSVSPQASHT